MPPVTAVVVVHRFERDGAAAAVASLAASTDVDLDIVVVYNGDAAEWSAVQDLCVMHRAATVGPLPNEGFAAAINAALAVVPVDHAVFLLNDDAAVRPDTIHRCLDHLDEQGPSCVSVAPLVLHAADVTRVDSFGVVVRRNGEGFNGFEGHPRNAIGDVPRDVLGPCFSAALFRPGAFTDNIVGPLTTDYFLYYEDVDWNIRARRRGFTCSALPDAVAVHRHAATTRLVGEARRYEMVQRNLLLLPLAVLSWRSVVRIWAGRLVVHAKGLITGPYRRERVASFAGALRRAPAMLRRRKHSRGTHRIADRELFRYADGHSPAVDTATYTLPGQPSGDGK